jgi:hypothetical protein
MDLSQAQFDQARAWFAIHGIHCCFCDRSEENPYDLALTMFALPAVEGAATFPVLAISCPDCAKASFYNAKIIGLVE